MRLAAFDLSWDGPTGWVLWDDILSCPVEAYGTFSTKGKSTVQDKVREIFTKTYAVVSSLIPLNYIVYEQTDWHQNLNNLRPGSKKFNTKYAQERMVQRCLGRAEATFILSLLPTGLPVISIGAMEAKREFGASRKDAAARLIAEEYPRFEFRDWKRGWLIDTSDGAKLEDHISDAIVIASVMSKRLHLENKLAA